MTTPPPPHPRLIPVRLFRDEIWALAASVVHGSFCEKEHERREAIENDKESRWLFYNVFKYYRSCGGIPPGLESVLDPDLVKGLRVAFEYHLARLRAAYDIRQRVKGYPREEHKLRA